MYFKTYTIRSLITAPIIPTDFLWEHTAFFGILVLICSIAVFVIKKNISKETKLVSKIKATPEVTKVLKVKSPEMKITLEEISFLPVVTEEPKEVISQEKKQPENSVSEMNKIHKKIQSKKSIADLNFDFLPIVNEEVDLVGKYHYQISEQFDESLDQVNTLKTKNISVIFETVITHDQMLTKQPNKIGNKAKSEEAKDLDVIFEALQIVASGVNLEDNLIDWSSAFAQKQSANISKEEKTIEELLAASDKVKNEVSHNTKPDLMIPKPKFIKAKDLETMVLLENMEAMGDHREIPYLKYLLEKETTLSIKERIKELISSFTTNYDGIYYFKATDLEAEYNVFHELFKKCDLESKIILLDEMVAVGDEKEIPLLTSLLTDKEPIIRQKAATTLDSLHKRLAKAINNEVHGFPKETKSYNNTIVEKGATASANTIGTITGLNFELDKSNTLNKNKNKSNYHDNTGNTLFDHLCSVSSKFYNKLNR